MHIKTVGYFLIFIIFIITGCVGTSKDNSSINQTTNTSPLTSNVTTTTTSPQLNKILGDFVTDYATTNYLTAISATVKCGNSSTISGVAGTLESTSTTPINTNSLFQIGSTSKSFTSVVILQLANDPSNHFNLHDTIGKWFKNNDGYSTYPQWESVTITQLMNMSSGIPDYFNNSPDIFITSLVEPTRYFSPTELVSSVASMPVFFAPGQGFNYSNTNYVLLGMLIQKITGNSPITEIQNRIFKKLHLNHTYFPDNLPASVIPIEQMTNGYAFIDFFSAPYNQMNKLHNLTWNSLSIYYTAGGIISTPEDLIIYNQALFNPGKLLTADEIKNFMTNMVSQNPTPGFPNGGQPITQVSESIPVGYGLGVFNIYSTESSGSYYMYNGATLGYGSYYAYYPKLNMYTTFMINNGINMTIQNVAYQNLINEVRSYTITTQCTKK